MKKQLFTLLSISFILILFSCGGNAEKATSAKVEAKTDTATESVPSSISFSIEGNDLMQFNLDKIEVVEGQEVTVTLKHVGQMSVDIMGHNWVLLANGTDVAGFGAAAVAAKETGYIPASLKDKVIAYTETIGGGQEASITFTAPKPGYYTFICSFPGHYGVMQGTFISKPR